MTVNIRPLNWDNYRFLFWRTDTIFGGACVCFDKVNVGELDPLHDGPYRDGPYERRWHYELFWYGLSVSCGPFVCDSLEHGKACVEAAYLTRLKPAFDFAG